MTADFRRWGYYRKSWRHEWAKALVWRLGTESRTWTQRRSWRMESSSSTHRVNDASIRPSQVHLRRQCGRLDKLDIFLQTKSTFRYPLTIRKSHRYCRSPSAPRWSGISTWNQGEDPLCFVRSWKWQTIRKLKYNHRWKPWTNNKWRRHCKCFISAYTSFWWKGILLCLVKLSFLKIDLYREA